VFSVRRDLHSPTTTQAQFAVCVRCACRNKSTETRTVTWSTVKRHWSTANKQNLSSLHCVVIAWLSARVFVFKFQTCCLW